MHVSTQACLDGKPTEQAQDASLERTGRMEGCGAGLRLLPLLPLL